MTSTKLWVSLVAVFALVFLSAANVAAFGDIVGLRVNGLDVMNEFQQPVAVEAGQTISVEVIFRADDDFGFGDKITSLNDVRVEARIAGADLNAVSKEIPIKEGTTSNWLLTIKMPESLDEEDLDQNLDLFVTVESQDEGQIDSFGVDLTLQRESNKIEILDVDMDNEVNAGDVLSLDVVVKNRGRQTSEDTFVTARIPALKLQDKAYFGDLVPMDQDNPEKEDSNERRLSLRIPSNTPAGVYVVEIEASNDDSVDTITQKVVVTGAQMKTQVVAPVHTRSFNVGETGKYTLVLVNSGNQVGVFELVVESPAGVTVDISEPVVAVPAGSSKTVNLEVKADKAETYNFAVNVHSGGDLVTREEFTAKVEGTNGGDITKTNPTVLLTVVLAVIFVVLLIVLIVLLTRRPEKSEEFGESYY